MRMRSCPGEFALTQLPAQPDTEVPSNELDAAWLEIIASAQRTYPTFTVPRAAFVAYLCDRLPVDTPQLSALRRMHTADLYLACACTRGDVHAFAAFDDHCLRQLDGVLRKIGLDAEATADVKQDLRGRLLVGDTKQAEILNFTGRGDLRGWVRTIAVRQALRRRSRARREVSIEDDELLRQIAAPGNHALDPAKERYRQAFRRAFATALRALPDREQTVLRQYYVDGLTIDELAGLYRMHRSTAARLLTRARCLVREATWARMRAQLDVQTDDLDSILRMIESQLEISLRALRRRPQR